MKKWLSMVKQAVKAWSDDAAPSKGAALAYYTTFSIAPMLFIAISVAGLVFGREAVQGAVFQQISGMISEQGAEAIREMLAHLEEPSTGILSTVVGVVVLLVSASTVFAQLQTALDEIWDAPEASAASGIWNFVRARLLSFGMVLGMSFVIATSLLLSTAVAALGQWWAPLFGEVLGHLLDLVLSFAMLTAVFALIYKYVPRVHIEWRDVWVGAAVTAALFTIGKWALGLYLGKSDVASSFGAFGSLAILLIWVYYSAQIFLLGAEFTWVYSGHYGSRKGTAEAVEQELVPTMPVVPPPAAPSVPVYYDMTRKQKTYAGAKLAAALGAGLVLRTLLQRADWSSLKRKARRGRRYMFG